MQTRSVRKLALWTFALLFSTLACRAATRLIIPDTPTPAPSPTIPSTATLQPTIPAPTATPSFEAACPSLLSEIMTAATTDETEEEPSIFSKPLEDEQDLSYMVNYTFKDDKLWKREDFFVPENFDKQLDRRAAHEWIWDYFAAIVPASERKFVTEFSAISDGRGSVLGAVSQTFESPTKWALRIDILDASDHYSLTFTLMHEFGHLLTLKPSQVAADELIYYNPDNVDFYERAAAACPRYFTGEGCSTPESYINEFFNRYWTAIYPEWQEIDRTEADAAYYGALSDFYKTYQDQFLTDYAATSPEEDIAESWSFFVLAPRPELNSIADEKILFFYEYPELIQLRQEILTRLCVEFPQ